MYDQIGQQRVANRPVRVQDGARELTRATNRDARFEPSPAGSSRSAHSKSTPIVTAIQQAGLGLPGLRQARQEGAPSGAPATLPYRLDLSDGLHNWTPTPLGRRHRGGRCRRRRAVMGRRAPQMRQPERGVGRLAGDRRRRGRPDVRTPATPFVARPRPLSAMRTDVRPTGRADIRCPGDQCPHDL
jgi:hypothetical protein